MRNLKTQGLIIQKRSLGEKDYVLTIFTPFYGKIQAFAKGAKQMSSKFTGHLDLLNVCDFQLYQSPKNYIVTECYLHTAFSKFRENLDKFYIASKMAKLIKSLETENENCEDIYHLLMETFVAIEKHKKEDLIFESFKIKLFFLLGLMPDVYCTEYSEFCKNDSSLKKLLKHLLNQPYEEIIKVYLNQKEANSLQNLTNEMIEYSLT